MSRSWPCVLALLVGCAPPMHAVPAPARPSAVRASPAAREPVESPELARADGDGPTVKQAVEMALAAARGLSAQRIRSLARRARLTGLVPQLRLSAERGLQQDLSSTTGVTTSQSHRRSAATADDFSFGASLTFELDRLVYAPDEVRLLSVERWLAGDQRKLVSEVIKLYFQRQRLLRERADARAPDGELDASIAEVEALLDGMTAGAFGAARRPGR